jgi:hypothetical protein
MEDKEPVPWRTKLTLKTSRLGPAMVAAMREGNWREALLSIPLGNEGESCARCMVREQCRLHGTVLADQFLEIEAWLT